MPKLKTNRSVAKRFKRTKSGKFKKRTAGRRHNLGGKSRKLKRHSRRSDYISPSDEKRIRRLLPYA